MNALIVEQARAWIGTPYLHGSSVRGAGCDCLGLLRGIWRAVEGVEPVLVPNYSPDWDEPQKLEVLQAAAAEHLVQVDLGDVAEGDVLLFRMKSSAVAKHLGIQAETGESPSFVHAYAGHSVMENALSAPWMRRVVGRFRFPCVVNGKEQF